MCSPVKKPEPLFSIQVSNLKQKDVFYFMDRSTEVRKVLIITLMLNIVVSAAKILYGMQAGSVAILSDGFHSMFDGVSNIAGLVAINISAQPPDEKHPYGHRKYETIFTIFIGVLMLFTCFEILTEAYSSIKGDRHTALTTTSMFIMLGTLFVNIFVSTYEKHKGRQLQSEFLIADAQHTRSDIYVTIGVLLSIPFVMMGYTFIDPLVGVIVGIIVARVGLSIIRDSANSLADTRAICPVAIRGICKNVDGVMDCHKIRTRGIAGQVFVDLHVQVDPSISIEEAHTIAHNVALSIKSAVPEVIDVMVHVEPHEPTTS
jgi:cation diffusion facilitator family transporter